MAELPTTLDGILNRRVLLEQPAVGFRVAVDTVLLAAAVPAETGNRVLDLGCGVGGAMLCLACRIPELTGVGREIQADLAELCRRNIERNSFAVGFDVRWGDATQVPPDMRESFDHVLMNPPYHEEKNHDASPDVIKRTANTEKTGDLVLWIDAAALALKPSGTLTIIHRADRRQEIVTALHRSFGKIEVLPLLPKEGAEAKRIIIRAYKNASFSVRECKPLVMHKNGGGYTDKAEEILRDCQSVVFQSP